MKLLEGKRIAAAWEEETKEGVDRLTGRPPTLAFLLIGHHPPSQAYVAAKKKGCERAGISSLVVQLPFEAKEREVLHKIDEWNRDPTIDGILIQLPLPPHLSPETILPAVDPAKDVDGFHPLNVGKLLLGRDDGFASCTPLGICRLLEKSQIPIEGRHVAILGRSNIVGKPLAALLMQKKPHRNATVTLLHSHSKHLKEIAKTADLLVAALGSPAFVTPDMVRPGAVVIDVGINRLPDGKLVGDVDYPAVAPHTSAITPVPGGVGPMTIAALLANTLTSRIRRCR